ncbi:MAG: DinB family protein [Pyrinomonadaceae bacterium]
MNIFNRPKWFEREFPFGLPVEMLPNLIERLRGTPAVYRARVKDLSRDRLTLRMEGSWSIQENVGHIVDLEELWLGRVKDFADGAETLRLADISNSRTNEANHNESSIDQILDQLTQARPLLVKELEKLPDDVIERTALHPRLKTPMKIMDLAYFVAEHDVHHLVTISELHHRAA